jgi:carbonic anhydrase/acetyltransferase-like protein (isoleucine patch superfamily)
MATGVSVFPGATVESESEVWVNAVVHVNTRLPEQTTVPIGWIAVGQPPHILPPRHTTRYGRSKRNSTFRGPSTG